MAGCRVYDSSTSQIYSGPRYDHRWPDQLTYEEVVDWIHHLIRERHQAASSVNIAVNAVRFLYGVTLQRDVQALRAAIPRMKRNTRRAEVYARSEIEAILSAPAQPRDRDFLMTVYAGGLRLSEATHLQTKDTPRHGGALGSSPVTAGSDRFEPVGATQRQIAHARLSAS
jgi:integrase/recombinase XerD